MQCNCMPSVSLAWKNWHILLCASMYLWTLSGFTLWVCSSSKSLWPDSVFLWELLWCSIGLTLPKIELKNPSFSFRVDDVLNADLLKILELNGNNSLLETFIVNLKWKWLIIFLAFEIWESSRHDPDLQTISKWLWSKKWYYYHTIVRVKKGDTVLFCRTEKPKVQTKYIFAQNSVPKFSQKS